MPTQQKTKPYAEMRVGDLTVIPHIQRTPPQKRVEEMARNWDPFKEGIFLVAEITDPGEYQGVKHCYDAGTRWRAAKMSQGEDYVVPCFIQPMTLREAAAKFVTHNADSNKPSPLDQYTVGVEARNPLMLAIKDGLDAVGIVGASPARYGNGTTGQIHAIKACERIVVAATARSRASGTYAAGSRRLAEVLTLTRQMYLDESAHDADAIQAVARLWLLNEELFQKPSTHTRMVSKVGLTSVKKWQARARDLTDSMGGSSSRSTVVASLMAREFNKGLRNDSAKLRSPKVLDD